MCERCDVVNFKQYGSVRALDQAFGPRWLYIGRSNPRAGLAQSPLANPFKVKDFGGNKALPYPTIGAGCGSGFRPVMVPCWRRCNPLPRKLSWSAGASRVPVMGTWSGRQRRGCKGKAFPPNKPVK
jgi:hypothetical protein